MLDHVWLIVACVVLATAAAAIYVTTAPHRYQAESQMLVSPVPSDSPTLIGLPVLHASADPTRDVLTAASLITTPQVASAVITALHLNTSPGALLANVQATPLGNSNLVAVQAQSSTAEQAQAIANAFANQVIATRAAALHAAIAAILPGLIAQLNAIPAVDRSTSSVGPQVGQLEQLRRANDPTISIAAQAGLPAAPYTPKTRLSLVAGVLAGLLLGIGAAFARQSLDPRLQRDEQLRELFDLPVLAKVPNERTRRHGQPMLPNELSMRAAEGYRTLRTLLTARASRQPQAYLLTSSAPAEGKTTSAINLTDALAQGGNRVILIEADLRRPRIAETLDLNPTYGTEDVMIGAADLDQALITTRFGGLPVRILAVRHPGVDVANRMSFAVAEQLVRQAKALADFVVIDSPPLLAVSDALPWAHLADEVIIIARLGVSKLVKLSELYDMLVDHGSTPTGVMVIGESPGRLEPYDYYGVEDSSLKSARNGGARGRVAEPPAPGR